MERTGEIGLLRAVGLARTQVRTILLLGRWWSPLLTTVIGVRHHCGRPEKQPNSQSSPRSTPGPTECNHQ
jgi:hypothetical protein